MKGYIQDDKNTFRVPWQDLSNLKKHRENKHSWPFKLYFTSHLPFLRKEPIHILNSAIFYISEAIIELLSMVIYPIL